MLSKMRKFWGSCSGFTLMELLVVISIIMVLAAILLPALQEVREKARQVVCMNNQKQMYVATMLYIQNWGGYFPCGCDGESYWTTPAEGLWFGKIYPYLKNTDVFICKSYPSSKYPYNRMSYSAWILDGKQVELSYGINTLVVGMQNANRLSQKDVGRTPGNVPLMDGTPANSGPWANGSSYTGWPHSGGDNFLALDGHVEWTYSGASNWAFPWDTKPGYQLRWGGGPYYNE